MLRARRRTLLRVVLQMRSDGLRRGDNREVAGVDGGEWTTTMPLETSKFVHKRWTEFPAEVTELIVKRWAEIE
jgi:hypothetical protein